MAVLCAPLCFTACEEENPLTPLEYSIDDSDDDEGSEDII